ncbi:choice-of-anchor C family PEP-CTERM protein [Scleromatobacter humisilvae]|uniref:Choice-of-anchor C family protein n=1 Tax=Scleromatobacter humisilvae TaxID=2897159 RepID=A0A9X2BZV9_9BURK|nr:choice-of-anchor C family protein [Scleromatobacter humisilvae]MCK9685771.1 choice-of-anchor C family protein [Scleromatobacter humisilvae]
MFNLKASVVSVSFLALTAAAQASTNLVADGSFSEGSGVGSYSTTFAGGNIGAWNVTSGSVDLIGSYWAAPTGYSIDLDGNSPGAISQDLSLATGGYLLTFSLAGNPDGGSAVKSVEVAIDGVTHDFTFDTTGQARNNMGWLTESVYFSNTAATTTLSFTSKDAGGPYGAALADISVTAVPEPGSTALMLAGLGMVGVMASRRKRGV